MLQNATPLRKSAPWPLNISDEHVSCTAPATRHESLQIVFKCPTLAIVVGTATKPSRLLTSGKVQNPLHLPRKITSEPSRVARACCGNLLRATTAYTFSTSQLPKVLRSWCGLHILISKFAPCQNRNGVHFFDITTSKSVPTLVCLPHSDMEMCFAQQWRALPKVLRTWGCFFTFFTCTCALRRSGLQLFISHLARWLCTRRFSEPTLRVNRDFPTFSRACIFFLLTFSLLWSSSSLLVSDSSHFCFSICPYCWKFDF